MKWIIVRYLCFIPNVFEPRILVSNFSDEHQTNHQKIEPVTSSLSDEDVGDLRK